MTARNGKTRKDWHPTGSKFFHFSVHFNHYQEIKMQSNDTLLSHRQSIIVTSDHYATATIVADFFLSDDHPLEIGWEIPLISYEAYSRRTLVDIDGQDYPLNPFTKWTLLQLEAFICRFVEFRRPSGRVTGLNNRVMQLAAIEISRRVAEEYREGVK